MDRFCKILAGATAVWAASAANAFAAGDGYGWDQLEALIDPKVENVMQAYKIPGLTVAVSKNGKLILWKGYGYALYDQRATPAKVAPMKFNMRTRIGSVSKALITGPAGYKLLKENNLSLTDKVYGANGVFNNRFFAEIGTGSKRFYPIVAMAINTKNWVYTWYANGTVSVGSSDNLTEYQAPKPFTLPAGKSVTDIHEIAIANNDRAYVWYKDGSRSIGSSTKLDNYSGILMDEDGEDPVTPKMPTGKTILNVVGIGIAKSNNHVFVWYDDGTLSSGSSTDFTKHFSDKSYSLAIGMSRYGVRAMGIASNDHVYTWHTNGKAQSGMSNDLDKYRAPYNYSVPNTPPLGGPDDLRTWYYDITIRDLMDHTSGFRSSSTQSGIAAMFNTNTSSITYEQIHRYVLRTRQLRWAPGTYTYDNQNFGVWTLLTPQISGKSYRNYAVNNYLQPMGMKNHVRPLTTNADARDSWGHKELKGSVTKFTPYSRSYVTQGHTERGLAAGGWTASAGDILYITDKLDTLYPNALLDAIGWFKGDHGRLQHHGKRDDGTAYVAMFPANAKTSDGRDLSDIHVAITANIGMESARLEYLANHIVREVDPANVSSAYDIWKIVKPAN